MTIEELLAAGPNFFRSDTPPSPFSVNGIEIGAGWYPLVHRMVTRIEALLTTQIRREKTYCIQLKQKFGGLKCYSATYSLIREEVSQIIREAQNEADHTCEYCGAEGKLFKNNNGFLRVACPTHNN